MKILLALLFCVVAALSPASSTAQQPPPAAGSPSVEKKLKELPSRPLFWRIENFAALDQAKAAVGPTGLVADFSGKVWLFTLGPKDGATPGATKVAEVGPLPPIQAFVVALVTMLVAIPEAPTLSEEGHRGDLDRDLDDDSVSVKIAALASR